jgi:acyl-coenzyme A thioesterase PaaI-like protein
MRQDTQPPFADTLGIRVIRSEPDRIDAELPVRPELGNRNGNMHGGAVMAFAAIAVGDTARAECTALHRGRTTMVWQTRITRASDGKLAAIVTQTQLVIAGKFGK